MIQRKQTIYLVVAFILLIACLCLPIGRFVPDGMGVSTQMFNLWTISGNGEYDFTVCPLFVILVLSAAIMVFAILAYRKRKVQSKLCMLIMLLLIGWYAYYVFQGITIPETFPSTFHVEIAAAFPLLAIIFTYLARRGVLADEALVRSMDRIR